VRTVVGRSFDLVLCDVRLGDGHGGECLRVLRAAQPNLGRRFVFITGDAGSLEGFAADAADLPILAKPFTGADLDRVLGEVGANV
jgi:CheY-like chemotaxis protein